jgi:signal transduction histidine kinase
LNKEEFQISKLISDETRRWYSKAEDYGVKLEVVDCSGLPSVLIDVIRIRTVLGNLIDNAIKYSPSGSRIKVNCSPDEHNLVMSVCDDGPAIPLEQQVHIFERFYRGKISGKSEVPGRGLGLFIVKQIVELHHGKIHLECGQEKGNCFLFSLLVNQSTK